MKGWHEPIGDTIGLSVSTPAYLKHIGLLDNDEGDPKADFNFLFSMALEKIAFLPSAYIFDS
jgi:peptidyl-dipeptidase A